MSWKITYLTWGELYHGATSFTRFVVTTVELFTMAATSQLDAAWKQREGWLVTRFQVFSPHFLNGEYTATKTRHRSRGHIGCELGAGSGRRHGDSSGMGTISKNSKESCLLDFE